MEVNESANSIDTECLVQEVLAQLGHEPHHNQGGRRRRPTSGPQRVRSVERKEIKPTPHTPSGDSWHGHSSSAEGVHSAVVSLHSVSAANAMGTLQKIARQMGSTK